MALSGRIRSSGAELSGEYGSPPAKITEIMALILVVLVVLLFAFLGLRAIFGWATVLAPIF